MSGQLAITVLICLYVIHPPVDPMEGLHGDTEARQSWHAQSNKFSKQTNKKKPKEGKIFTRWHLFVKLSVVVFPRVLRSGGGATSGVE